MHLLKNFPFLFIVAMILSGTSLAAKHNISTSQDIASVTILDDNSKPRTSPLKGNIQIVGRQLQINGQPFIMKGICYSPVRKGGIYPDDLITNNPTDDDLAVIEKDFQMMHEAGINTVRTYEPLLDPRILDLLTKYELRTIVPAFNNHEETLAHVTSIISTLKNHPSTLIWEIGNEWNYNFFYSRTASNPQGIGLPQSVNLLENAAHCVRLLDDTHPISTVIGDLPPPTDAIWPQLNLKGIDLFKEIDLYGINVYSGITFGDRFTRWISTSAKPLYLAEFGTDAYNVNIGPIDPTTGKPIGGEDDNAQDVVIESLVNEILNNLSALNSNNVLIGGNLFEWNDEWWKPNVPPPGISDPPDSHAPGGTSGPSLDHVLNERWFGILDIDRNPRPAYYTLQKLYLKPL